MSCPLTAIQVKALFSRSDKVEIGYNENNEIVKIKFVNQEGREVEAYVSELPDGSSVDVVAWEKWYFNG